MSFLSNTALDLRQTLRQLRRAPGFTATAVITLALGIGATTAMYSVLRATLFEALPYPHADRLVGIGFVPPTEPPEAEQTGETAEFLLHHATSFASIGIADDGVYGQNLAVANSQGVSSSETVRTLRVSSGYLPSLGVAPLLGRTFSATDDLTGAAPTAVLSESLWRRDFNADPGIIGRTFHLNAEPYVVIGVMPAPFPTADDPDLWQPLRLSRADPGYGGDNFQLIARLEPGITAAQASAELATLTPGIYRQFPVLLRWGGPGAPRKVERLFSLQQIVFSEARPSLLALSLAVLIVLLMACLNLAGLLTARSATRRAELSMRSALGASQPALLRLLLMEGLVLAGAGSALGLIAARGFLTALTRFSPIDLPRLHVPAINAGAATFAVIAGGVTTLLVGALPALTILRTSKRRHLPSGRGVGETLSQARLGRSLLVAQVALATMLLSTTALLLGAFLHLRAVPLGVRPQGLFALQVNLKGTAYASATHTQQFVQAVETRLRSLPGVVSVATINGLPLDRGLNDRGFPLGRRELQGSVESRFITPGYLQTAGTLLLSGRDFSPSDTSTSGQVALINQHAADLWWPGRSPIGQYIVDEGDLPWRIVGVVADAHQRDLASRMRVTIYHPYTQVADATMKAINGWFPTTLLLRTADRDPPPMVAEDPELAHAAAVAVHAVDPEIAASRFLPMQSFLDRSVAAPRFFAWLAGAFAVFALLLSAIGLFGLLSYQVATRTREIGVRMALGSSRGRVLGAVLRHGLLLTAVGLLVGLTASYGLQQPLTSLLVTTLRVAPSEVSPLLLSRTLATLIAAAFMVLSSVLACLLPARRAASVDPTVALRAE